LNIAVLSNIKGIYSCIFFVWLFFFATSKTLIAQPDLRLYIPTSLDAGLHFAKIKKDSTTNWGQKPGSIIKLGAGFGFLYKERIGLHVHGAFLLTTYNFMAPNKEYSVSSITTTLQASPFILFPIKNKGPLNAHVGATFGWVHYGPDELREVNDQFTAVSNSYGPNSRFLSPELGITRIEKRTTVSILLTYQYLYRRDPTFNSVITDQSGRYEATGKGDYLGIRCRLAFEIGGAPKPKKLFVPPPPEQYAFKARKESVVQSIQTKQKYISMVIMDSGEIDNDSISVAVNGNYVLTGHRLTRDKVRIRLPLQEGKNTIVFYAHNEGDVPPNTARCFIRKGFGKVEFPVGTDLEKNAVIEVMVE
jgi:hypothetical protein